MPAILKDVAREAGISVSTASRVIRNTGYVSDETRQRVYAAIQKLNYKPNNIARGLKYGRTFAIGFVMHDIANPFFSNAVKGAEQYLRNEGLDFELVLSNTSGECDREIRALELMTSRRVEGIILASTAIQECVDLVRKVVKQDRIPVVSIDNQLGGFEFGVVSAENQLGAYQLTSHLLEHGHKRIGIISGPPHESHARARLDGCMQALVEHGVDLDEDLFVAVGNWAPEHGYEITNLWLDLERPPTAIFSVNNLMCMGALSALRERNVRVPGDIAIAAFDDVEFGYLIQPRLTTLKYSYQKIGEEAIRLVLEAIQAKEPSPRPKLVKVPVQMRIGESCGCPPR